MSGKETSSSDHLSPLNASNKHLTGRNLFFPLALFSQVIPFILLPTNCLCLSPSRPVIHHLYKTMHLTHFFTLPFPPHPIPSLSPPLLSLPFPSVITLGRASILPTRKPPLLTVAHDEPSRVHCCLPPCGQWTCSVRAWCYSPPRPPTEKRFSGRARQ